VSNAATSSGVPKPLVFPQIRLPFTSVVAMPASNVPAAMYTPPPEMPAWLPVTVLRMMRVKPSSL
jgi:hypothetical protein